jgi:hypothetical protein
MASWVHNATSAFEHALAELVGETKPAIDPANLGRAAALSAVAGQLWTEALGPFYDSGGVRSLLGNVSKQAVSDRARRHRLLALRTESGRLVYPAFQFDRRTVVDGLGDVLAIVAPDDTEAWFVASWLTTSDPAMGNRSPMEALRAGHTDQVLDAAREVAASLRG